MSWVDEERLRAGRRNWNQIREHKKRKEKGYQKITVEGLDITVYPARNPSYLYELISPSVDPQHFRENVAHILNGCEEFAAMADAGRKVRTAKLELPSLSKVKQLNPNTPF